MAIARVSANDATGSGTTSAAATYPLTPTTGNLLIAIAYADENSNGPSTPAGWSVATNAGDSSGNISIYYKISSGTEGTVTSTDALASEMAIGLYEYTGNTASPFDKQSTLPVGGSGLSVSSGTTPSTTQGQELIIAAGAFEAVSNTFSSVTNGFTNISSINGKLFTAEKIVTIVGTYETTFTTTGSSGATHGSIATFKAITEPSMGYLRVNKLRPHAFSPGLAR